MSETRLSGTVKWFSDEKGWGFIRSDHGEELFVHHKHINADGFRKLTEGQKVTFEIACGDKGLYATNVVGQPGGTH
jgi:CspA family cold shock protein